jgi:DNA-binding response OmpR family regulator
VIISARVSVDDQVRGLDCGAIAYLTKPFSIDQLRPLLTTIGATDVEGRERLRAESMARLDASRTGSAQHAAN